MNTVSPSGEGALRGEQIRSLELLGYVVLPGVLGESEISQIHAELDPYASSHTTYSDKQWYVHNTQWLPCPYALELMACGAVPEFLADMFGDELICISGSYARTDPGYPGMALHTDSQPYGSKIFGPQASSPLLVRVLYYLDELTQDCAPLRVIPYSHLCLHHDANPYLRYKSHPEEVRITCPAGSAVIINQRIFHAVGPNHSPHSRSVYAVGYRPAWAGPIEEVPEHPAEKVDALPPHVRKLFRSPNTRRVEVVPNWSDDLPTGALRLGPSRWELDHVE